MHHDYNYKQADEGKGTRSEADEKMIEELNQLKNNELTFNEKMAKYFTKGVIGVKHKLGLGFKPKNRFKVGDRVRITTYKTKPKWTKEIFTVEKINNTNPITYKLIDLNREPILGSFYIEELRKTKF